MAVPAMSSNGLLASVRHTQLEDVPGLVALQRKVYPDIPAWDPARLRRQIEVFPQGQLMAELDGEMVGCASSLVVLWDEWAEQHSWDEITSAGNFDNHDRQGLTLYGAEVFVSPDSRGAGVGHMLYEGRRQICRRLNLKRIIACGRLPGYHQHAARLTAEQYAQKVVWGDLFDPVLSFQLREGFSYCGVMNDYIPDDVESLGHASIIVWLNPDFDPAQPHLLQQEEKP
ncbi:GNAT family N-acetyltransferase [Ottowia sp.]|uniref:GNAT family N-acetyltransferase n=1 Tax=Ottowia sp. TaxID=1898956 RepID=UPI003A8C7C7A